MMPTLDERLRAAKERYKKLYPRSDQRWTRREDGLLQQLVRSRPMTHGTKYRRWHTIGRVMGRSANSCQTRWATLRTANVYVELERARGK